MTQVEISELAVAFLNFNELLLPYAKDIHVHVCQYMYMYVITMIGS